MEQGKNESVGFSSIF